MHAHLEGQVNGIMSSPFGSLMVNIAQSSGSSAAAVKRRGIWTDIRKSRIALSVIGRFSYIPMIYIICELVSDLYVYVYI